MTLDRTSESIAHFSGLFSKTLEEARLRQEYSEFKSIKKKETDDAGFDFAAPRLKTSFEIGEYDPGVQFAPKDAPAPAQSPQATPQVPATSEIALSASFSLPPFSQAPDVGDDSVGAGPNLIFLPFVAIPASVATVTVQTIRLQDDDVFGDISGTGFLPVEVFHGLLKAAIQVAEALAPWSSETLAQDILSAPEAVHTFLAQLDAVGPDNVPLAKVAIARAEDVDGSHVNGAVVEEKPQFDSLLPAYIKAKHADALAAQEAEETPALAGDNKGETGLFDALDHPVTSYANSGHNVIAGANEAINVVDIQTSWIDAAVIAVAGDYVSLNAVSQINILSDHNYVDGYRQDDADAASKAYNIATVTEEAVESAKPTSTDQPEAWNTVHYEGDVTVTNVVKQHTYATDNDQLQLTFTANSTAIVTGENQTTNYAHADAFGSDYDLIVVGGSMVSLNVVNQTNLLLDDDYLSGSGLSTAAISDGDNLLHNKAEIRKQGADTHKKMAKEFKDTLKELKKSASDVMKAVAKHEAFEGMKALKVLKIDGNLTQMNIVDQINYLGDQDQVHMAQDAMQSAIDTVPVSITTGSNLLSNETIIETDGYDSEIMTAGNFYDDAFLYQADLIDTAADPLGVKINELASEAVAFLADDMIAKSISEQLEAAGFTFDADTGGHTLDVLQTMTA